jgi:hypothetical protein
MANTKKATVQNNTVAVKKTDSKKAVSTSKPIKLGGLRSVPTKGN